MYTVNEQPGEFATLNARSKAIVAELLKELTPSRAGIKISAESELYRDPAQRGKLYCLREGALACSRGGRQLFFFEAGDLIGTGNQFGCDQLKITTDFAVVADEYEFLDLQKKLSSDPRLQGKWAEYFAVQFQILTLLMSGLVKDEGQSEPEMKMVEAGETIIQQGSEAAEVFNMVDGHAEVFVDGVKVGEVLADEIFGALAALTGTPRTASVVASTSCMVLAMPAENFSQLIVSRPHTIQKMMQDMARTIVALNQQVVSYKKG